MYENWQHIPPTPPFPLRWLSSCLKYGSPASPRRQEVREGNPWWEYYLTHLVPAVVCLCFCFRFKGLCLCRETGRGGGFAHSVLILPFLGNCLILSEVIFPFPARPPVAKVLVWWFLHSTAPFPLSLVCLLALQSDGPPGYWCVACRTLHSCFPFYV